MISQAISMQKSDERIFTDADISLAISDGVTKLVVIDALVYDVTNYLNRLGPAKDPLSIFYDLNSIFTGIRGAKQCCSMSTGKMVQMPLRKQVIHSTQRIL